MSEFRFDKSAVSVMYITHILSGRWVREIWCTSIAAAAKFRCLIAASLLH